MRYLKVLAGCALTAAAVTVAPTAASAVPPTREIVPAPDDITITGQCDFSVLAHIDGYEIDKTFSNKAGDTVKLIGVFPGNRLTLTNVDSGRSITLMATGQFHAQAKHDGSAFGIVAGHGPFITHPVTGEPGIWYISGQLKGPLDDNGDPISLRASGQLVNLCDQLAG
jgi:hypothetical protein